MHYWEKERENVHVKNLLYWISAYTHIFMSLISHCFGSHQVSLLEIFLVHSPQCWNNKYWSPCFLFCLLLLLLFCFLFFCVYFMWFLGIVPCFSCFQDKLWGVSQSIHVALQDQNFLIRHCIFKHVFKHFFEIPEIIKLLNPKQRLINNVYVWTI